MRSARWWALTGAVGLAISFTAAAAGTAAGSPNPAPVPHRMTLKGSLAPAQERAHPAGTVPGSAAVSFDLLLTLILGIPLSATIVRRLRRLRQAALQLAQDGPPVDLPRDRRRDEVGDLSRAFDQMQQRLQQQEEARRAFVSTASHELRTPLASLDGMLELLDDDLGSGDPDLDDARSLLGRARGQSRRLARLAADLLDLSRLDAQVELRSEPVELAELSRAVIAEFDLGTEERGIISTLDDSAARATTSSSESGSGAAGSPRCR